MKKRAFALILALCTMFMFNGCNKNNTPDNVIQPINRNIKTPTLGIPLYFGYKNQPYLCAELREISQSYDASVEQLVINELIKGPANASELYPLIPNGTVASVSGISDTLFVTLSNEFLDAMPGENKNYAANDTDLAAILSRRRLAIYSIVNTITEIGNYSRVQILIKDSQASSGYRPKMYDVGFAGNNDGKFLDTLPRTPEIILTPQNAVSGTLSLMQEKQWNEVYKCLYQGEPSMAAPISAYDFESYANRSGLIIEDFSINNNVTYNDNGTAIANINFSVRSQSGSTEYTQIPIRLVLSDNIWRVEYNSIIKILEKGN